MSICSFCCTENPDGTVYCDGCGSAMDSAGIAETASSPDSAENTSDSSLPTHATPIPVAGDYDDYMVKPLPEGHVVDGRYEILAFAGRGSHALVYRADDRKGNRTVALKILDPAIAGSDEGSEIRQRFIRESEICQKLTSPNIVPVFDASESKDGPYMAMEWIDGKNLRDILDSQGALEPEIALGFSLKIASALEHAHGHDILHRDVKPSNIFIGGDGKDARLGDFGIAKAVGAMAQSQQGLTTPGTMIGTLEYLAPEYIEGKDLTPRYDIYSFGAVLYEMLAGEAPFVSTNPMEMLKFHATLLPPPLESRNPKSPIPPNLESVIMKCLEKNPDNRFSGMAEVIKALEACQESSAESSRTTAAEQAAPELSSEIKEETPERINLVGTKIRDYEIEELLGEGGMACVYKARHTLLGSYRAIKVIRKDYEKLPNFFERFMAEAQIAESISHPNLATLHDFSQTEEGMIYAVWEYVEGETVQKRLLQHGKPVPLREAVDIVEQTARGLSAAHAKGIFHRDISPDNLMILEAPDGSVRVKVIDFGIAKSVHSRYRKATTGVRAFLGKVGYAAPEQIGNMPEGEMLDGRADIFALGVVFFELLTGKPLFKANSLMEYMRELSVFNPAAIGSSLPRNVPVALGEILLRAVSPDRNKRFDNLDIMLDAFENWRNAEAKKTKPEKAPPHKAASAKVSAAKTSAAKTEEAPAPFVIAEFQPPKTGETIALKNLISAPALISNLYRKRKTGVLTISFSPQSFKVYFKEGQVAAISGDGADTVHDVKSLATIIAFFRNKPEVALSWGSLTPDSFKTVLSLPSPRLVWILTTEADAARHGKKALKLKEKSKLAASLDDLAAHFDMSPEASFLLSRLTDSSTLHEAMTASGCTETVAWKLILCMIWLGYLKLSESEPEWLDSGLVTYLVDSEETRSESDAKERQEIIDGYRRIKSAASPSEMLEVPPTPIEKQVTSAFERLTKQYKKENFSEKTRKALSHELAIIRMKLSESYLLLLERTSHRDFSGSSGLEHLDLKDESYKLRITETKSRKEKELAERKIMMKNYFERAKKSYEKEDYWGTLELLKVVLQNNPENIEALSIQAHCQVKNPKIRRKAIDTYEQILSINSECADTWLELGELYESCGLKSKARRCFTELLKLNPKDLDTKVLKDKLKNL